MKKLIFVSSIGGSPFEKDAQGWISSVTLDGQIQDAEFVSGLNAPKGMALVGRTLWVTDIDEICAIDIATRKIMNRIKVPHSKFLNDIVADTQGDLYVSDTLANKIFKISKGRALPFLTGPQTDGPNGLFLNDNSLWMVSWGRTGKDFSTKVPGRVVEFSLKNRRARFRSPHPVGNLDGVFFSRQDTLIFSDFASGKIYEYDPKLKSTSTLLEGLKQPADIAYLSDRNWILVPLMGSGELHVYPLDELRNRKRNL